MTMADKTIYTCSECGHTEPKWLGRCPDCSNWNTFVESTNRLKKNVTAARTGNAHGRSVPVAIPLHKIESTQALRMDSGIQELNRVLGGGGGGGGEPGSAGIMRGASVLVAGEPGIGKSTLMLMIASHADTKGRVLYVTGEESPEQIAMRARRTGTQSTQIEILAETDVDSVITALDTMKPSIVIVDSIQTLKKSELGMVAGTVNQMKFCAQELIDWTKLHNTALFLVGHVTKEGLIAGPKVIEHMVDTVLQFEQADQDLRFLRSSKNRFGSVDEIGIFRMEENGLVQPDDTESLFLEKRQSDLPAGIVVAPIYEGSRVILLEIQSLVVPVRGGTSRVYSDRIDARVVWKAQAVLEKHCSLDFNSYDMYVNVAGGLSIREVGIELPLVLSLFSARTGVAFPSHAAVTGEVSLAGEIRNVRHLEKRIKTARELGFSLMVGPLAGTQVASRELKYEGVSNVQEAVKKAFSGHCTNQ
ncbi:MAG: DNA repair protein RadA [Spirochaetaceae bacterium]|nr:MAG: DNA repair protein RadA [Spirochaetaceae bacterium]